MVFMNYINRHLPAVRIVFAIVLIVVSAQYAAAQNVKGYVLDKNGDGIIGATVVVRGTTTGQSTGVEGDFEFSLPENIKYPLSLDVSYIGYEGKTVIVRNANEAKKEIVVTLYEEKNQLNDVVVIGYGHSSKKNLVGSVAKVDGDDIVMQTKDAPLVAMQGKAAGVYIEQATGVPGGGASTINIRGKNSITSGTTPLYIVDGVPYNGAKESYVGYTSTGALGLPNVLALINPNDIESIEILKDADATAIYGTRGANGVVIITTKQGKAGKVKVDVSLSATYSKVTKRLDFLNTEEYLDLRRKAVQADLDRGDIKESDLNERKYPDLYLFDQKADYDWQDKMIGNTAPAYDANIKISGGNQNTSFLVSGGLYSATTTIISEDKYRRWNGKVSLQHHSLDKRFNMNGSISLMGLDMDSDGAGSLYNKYNTAPNTPMWDEDGNTYYIPGNSEWESPLSSLNAMGENRALNVVGALDLSYSIIKNLIVKVNMGYTYSNSNMHIEYRRYYYNPYKKNQTNIGYFINSNTNSINIEPQISYKLSVGKAHANLLAGATFYRTADHSIYLQEREFPSDAFLGNASAAPTISSHQNPSHETRTASVFGRIQTDWDNRYLLNLVLRRDGSSRFATGHQWGTFYSVGGGWIFSDEKFVKNAIGSWFTHGKLRTSYGVTGNDKISDYSYMTKYSTCTYPYEGNVGLYVNQLGNETLKWEETSKFDIGLELGFLTDRIVFNTSFYNNRSSNLLANEYLPSQSGFSSMTSNLNAAVDNRGWEFELNTVNVKTTDFSWTTNFNISFPKNKLVKFENLESSSYRTKYTIGKSIDQVRMYRYTGVDNQTGLPTVEDVNGDGIINSTDDYQYLGTRDPKFYGGFNNTFTYRNFSLDVNFYFRNRKYQYGYLYYYYNPIGWSNNVTHEMAENYWTTPGQDAKYPALTTTTKSDVYQKYYYHLGYSDFAFSSGSYIRLQNVTLSYSCPESITGKLGISSLRVYLQAKNLKVWTNYDSYDPEIGQGVPLAREIVLGLNVSF